MARLLKGGLKAFGRPFKVNKQKIEGFFKVVGRLFESPLKDFERQQFVQSATLRVTVLIAINHVTAQPNVVSASA